MRMKVKQKNGKKQIFFIFTGLCPAKKCFQYLYMVIGCAVAISKRARLFLYLEEETKGKKW